MNITKTDIEGLIVVEPPVWLDSRGYFFESFQAERYSKAGIEDTFLQDNEAFSNVGVLRGLHYQLPPFAQAKLVRVVQGAVLDVAVDIRPTSLTYGRHHSIILSGENKQQFYIPEGFAHGYLCLTDEVIFAYKCSDYYSKEHEGGIRFDDPNLNIDWQFDLNAVLVSDKDLELPLFGIHRNWPKDL